MPEQLHDGEAFALAHAFYVECQVVARFIDEKVRVPVDERAGSVPLGLAFQRQLVRAVGWLRSLDKLNHPGDFQAVTAGARALFEGAVDVTLMHFDPSNFSPEMMNPWDDSAKFKNAETVVRYLAEAGRQPEDSEKPIVAYATREKGRIENLRPQWWPNHIGKHPARVLGLPEPARELADRLVAECFIREWFVQQDRRKVR